MPSERSGAKNDSDSGESAWLAGLRTSNRAPRLQLAGEPTLPSPGVPRLDKGSGYTTPAGTGASVYRPERGLLLRLPGLLHGGTGSTSSWRVGRGLSYGMGMLSCDGMYRGLLGGGTIDTVVFEGIGSGLLGGGMGTGVLDGTGMIGLDGTGMGALEGTGIGLAVEKGPLCIGGVIGTNPGGN